MNHRSAHRCTELLSKLPSLLTLLLLGVGARAASVPGMYAAIVPDADPQQAAASAMAVVLVRLTGMRDAAANPVLAPLISDAHRYVQLERATTSGSTQVLFDGSAVRAAIATAGGTVWGPDRPLVWVALPEQEPAAADALHARLQSAALARGLPIVLASGVTPEDSSSPDTLLAAARRSGAAVALVAQVSRADPSMLEWTLIAASADGHWSGGAEVAIDGATDTLAKSARAIENAPIAELDCRVTGVSDLPSYANVFNAVNSAPGVTDVVVSAIDADSVTLHLKARSNQSEIARALASEHLHATGAATANELNYRYQAGQ